MICELHIKLGKEKEFILTYANQYIKNVEKVIETKDRFKLFEVLSSGGLYPAAHEMTIMTDTQSIA